MDNNDGCATKMFIAIIVVLVALVFVVGGGMAYNKSATAKTNAEASAYVRTAAADVDNLIRRQQATIDNMYERLLLAENTAIALENVESIGINSRAAADNSFMNGVFIVGLIIAVMGLSGLTILLGVRSERRLEYLERALTSHGQDAKGEGG